MKRKERHPEVASDVAKRSKGDGRENRTDARAWSSFVLDERRVQAIRNTVDALIPEDLRRFFGVAPEKAISTSVLKGFWFALESDSCSMRAVLSRYHDKQSDHRGLFSILGDCRTRWVTIDDFLWHLRDENPAYEAALDAYNNGDWN
ncbi:hypothetical protein CYMTET_35627 [Cymbomonas tetramitiformis]|uniref:Uncharacterized protein n=1 Tax=Cymbomonas tetramitiformis TaxID=36881 RepID=A0AAE0KNY9_9CHLO|nr:hypothetical protein CYMTET_35627 [Cymbomonas tetramitiformis]|eukprot:gene33-48_t